MAATTRARLAVEAGVCSGCTIDHTARPREASTRRGFGAGGDRLSLGPWTDMRSFAHGSEWRRVGAKRLAGAPRDVRSPAVSATVRLGSDAVVPGGARRGRGGGGFAGHVPPA